VPDDEVDKITHGNALRLFGWNPFAIRPCERCTAAALRAEAEGVDPVTRGRGRRDDSARSAEELARIVGATSGKRQH
jgi:hypothetical protein